MDRNLVNPQNTNGSTALHFAAAQGHCNALTSTAQTSSLEKSKTGKEFLEHSWLACNFTYKNHPPLTMIILTEFTSKIGLPARTAYNFLKQYKILMDSKITTIEP